MPIRSILLDVDDTLADWQSALARAVTAALVAHPHPDEGLPGRVAAAIRARQWVVRDGRVVARDEWRVAAEPLPPWLDALPGPEGETLARACAAALRPQPYEDAAVVPVLARGYTLGLLTNNPRAMDVLVRFGMAPDFREVITAPAGDGGKPADAAFTAAAGRLGAAPAETLLIAANLLDVEGALAAGLRAAWLDRHGDGGAPPVGAHHLRSLRDVPGLAAGL